MSETKHDLNALAARCEEGSGGDRELDGAIWRWLCQSLPRSERWNFPPAYTASIDAAVSFVERAARSWSDWSLHTEENGARFRASVEPMHDTTTLVCRATSPARALMAAALRALAEKEPTT